MAVDGQNSFNTLLPEEGLPSDSTVLPAPDKDDMRTLSQGAAHAKAAAAVPAEPQQIGRYRIVRVLGKGGMGKVYEAHDTKLERTVALKVMLPDAIELPSARERFLREARTMAAIRNDHVVTVFEVDEAGDTPYLAMEFLRGQALSGWLGRDERLRVRDIVRYGREIAAGLAAAHAKGLIHRDIKPANLWVETVGEDRKATAANDSGSAEMPWPAATRIKILDFGLARPISQDCSITQSGAVLGTPYYMSPEQARGDTVDCRSDLFSLGIVLYQLCTGQVPFRGPNMTAVLTSLAIDIPAPIVDKNPHVPEPLAKLVMWLLEKDPQLRPQSAEQVAAALRAIEARLPSDDHGLLQRGGGQSDSATTPTLGPNNLVNTIPNGPSKPAPATNVPPPVARRRRPLMIAAIAAALLGAIGVGAWSLIHPPAKNETPRTGFAKAPTGLPIRLGVLYSKTGTMATSERATLDGVKLAVQEINEQGGVLGRPLEWVAEDGQSDEFVFARKALKLIEVDKVACLFGCWTSASRKAVRPVVEKHDQLLFYPTAYEGLESSPNIVYGGSVPNQQMIPALRWMRGFQDKRKWFLVGLDAVYSRAVHAVIDDEANRGGSEIAGDEYILNNNTGIGDLMKKIEEADPDLIVNTIKGDTNVLLFRALQRSEIAKQAPILSFAVSESDLANLTPEEMEGNYAANSYFQSVNTACNRKFLKLTEKHIAADHPVSDQMQTTYLLVHLWALAAEKAGTENRKKVLEALRGLEFDAPQGHVTFDADTQHLVQSIHLGKISGDGQFTDEWFSPSPIRPEPFPKSRTRAVWEGFVNDLFVNWGGRWTKRG